MTAVSDPAAIVTPFAEAPGPGEALEVAENALWTRLPLPMALNHVNLFAFADAEGWTLIDAGIGTARGRLEMERLLAGPLAGRPVRRVIVTHYHPDHVGLAGWLRSVHGAEIVTSRTSWLYARMLVLDEHERVTPETEAFWRASGMSPEVLATRLSERPFNFADVVAPLPLGFTSIGEGDRLSFGERTWEVRLGQGHAPDQITLWSLDDTLVLGADQLLPSITPNIGVYATEPEADPLSDWLESCARFAALSEDSHFVLPGHKLPYSGLPLRMRQLAETHHGALSRLRRHLKEPRTAGECFVPVFGREISGQAYGLALAEAVAHVNHLYALGELERERRADGAWLWQAK
ncbi:MAG: MBL fold metallo-hydrolase [Rhodobacteraceae bacterium]|nr:MBL fold metallo-hydrolase [Paracoccaceae bacterium]